MENVVDAIPNADRVVQFASCIGSEGFSDSHPFGWENCIMASTAAIASEIKLAPELKTPGKGCIGAGQIRRALLPCPTGVN